MKLKEQNKSIILNREQGEARIYHLKRERTSLKKKDTIWWENKNNFSGESVSKTQQEKFFWVE